MTIKNKLLALYKIANSKFFKQFGFKVENATFDKIVDYLHVPKDSSSLAVTRIMFGLAMLFDIPDERGGAMMERRWGDPRTCHFPLFPFIQPLPMPHMAVVYAGLWFGALGIMLGYKYRWSASTFTVSYWYLLLVEKSYWNNHSYLFGLVALLLTTTEASCYWSLDANKDPSKRKSEVPYWNYFILKYQFFILYFMAGLKKGTAEWLTGYSVQNLSEHWVFEPFKLFLTVPQTDYLVVHWFVFAFDLTVAVWMMCSSTRHVAMVFCTMFHLMNSRLFRIGMFPWVCLATMPLFYPFDWPKKLLQKLRTMKSYIYTRLSELKTQKVDCQITEKESHDDSDDDVFRKNDDPLKTDFKDGYKEKPKAFDNSKEKDESKENEPREIDTNGSEIKHTMKPVPEKIYRKKATVYLVLFHVLSQAFLPFSHFLTLGYNNWTNGLYGYSWDMMVHTWDTHAAIVQIVDNDNHKQFYIDPYIYAPNERWTRHGDMLYQYARCLKQNLINDASKFQEAISDNISVYVDVWLSMNGRFTQRLFDPKVDMLKADWSPFEKVSYVMPLLDEALAWRADLEDIRKEVHSWSNYSDVIFLADFPGYEQEKFISEDLNNITLTILEGDVAYQPEVTKLHNGNSIHLKTGSHTSVANGIFHKVLNIGQKPAFYMYTSYTNNTEMDDVIEVQKLPLLTEFYIRLWKTFSFCKIMVQSFVQMLYSSSKCNVM